MGTSKSIIKFGVFNLTIMIIFCIMYSLIAFSDVDSFHFPIDSDKENKSSLSKALMYYSVIVQTTTGFGEIYPVSLKAKFVTICHTLLTFSLLGFFVFNFDSDNFNWVNLFSQTGMFIVLNVIVIMMGALIHLLNRTKLHSKKPDDLTFFDYFYYTTLYHTSIGFGDYYPLDNYGRLITMIHVFIIFTLISQLNEGPITANLFGIK